MFYLREKKNNSIFALKKFPLFSFFPLLFSLFTPFFFHLKKNKSFFLLFLFVCLFVCLFFSSSKYLEMFYLREKNIFNFCSEKVFFLFILSFIVFSFFSIFFFFFLFHFFFSLFLLLFLFVCCCFLFFFAIRFFFFVSEYTDQNALYYNDDLKKGSKNNYDAQFKLVIQITVGIKKKKKKKKSSSISWLHVCCIHRQKKRIFFK